MLEAVNLDLKISKAEYKPRLRAYQNHLHSLQRACREQQIGTVVVFEGWDAAGKGSSIRRLTARLEPRAFHLHATRAPRTHEQLMPWLWRFWVAIPSWGKINIFDRSWYGRVLVERVESITSPAQCERAYVTIRRFERMLADDRYEIAKLFLHISRDEQRRRLEALEADPQTAWMVEEEDWQHHEQYEEYRAATELMLEHTETEWAPWRVVEATNRHWSRLRVLSTIAERMENGLRRRGIEPPERPEAATLEAG
jgi:polyphosphate kinase 2 (PPK2 family)